MKHSRTILLIDWTGSNWLPGVYTKHSCLEPYGLECIGAFVKEYGYQVKIFQPRHNSLSKVVDLVKSNNPYLVGLSVKTYNFNRSLQLAKAIKTYSRKVRIVFGGDHPTLCPEIVKEKEIDYVIRGEGELAFVGLLKALDNNDDVIKVNNVVFLNGNSLIITPQKRLTNFDQMPFSLRDRNLLKNCRQYALMYPPPSQQKCIAQINYSRGCPYNCTFCASPQMWNGLVTYRNPKKVVEEIFVLKDKFNTNLIFYTDLSFNLNKKKMRELCREMINQDVNISWFCMCIPKEMDKGILQLMKEAGCKKIGWGIESLNEYSLCKIKPTQQFRIDEMQEILHLSHSVGIINRAYIMIGYPWEKMEDIENTFKMLKKLAIDELKVSFFTLFPGTPMYYKHKDLLLSHDLNRFTTDEAVIKVGNITMPELINVRKKIVREFFQSKEYKVRMKEKIRKNPHLKQSYDEFFDFLHHKGVLKRGTI